MTKHTVTAAHAMTIYALNTPDMIRAGRSMSQ